MAKLFKPLVVSAILCGSVAVVNAQFTQQGPKLDGAGSIGYAFEGYAVAISADGNTALVGGEADNGGVGAVWVYTRSAGAWSQQGQKLVASGETGAGEFGTAVALSADGKTALISGWADSSTQGAAWVFIRSNGIWTQQGRKFTGRAANGDLGFSVALSADGNTGLIAALNNGVQVITRSGDVWTEGPWITNPGPATWSVALSADGDTALLGAASNPPYPTQIGGYPSGAAWVFTRTNGEWTQQGGPLVGSDAIGGASQGVAVSLSADGNTAIVGGSTDNGGAGAAWVFTRSNGVWTQQGAKLVGSGATNPAAQGISVSLSADGNTALVAGILDNHSVGAAWVFHRTNGTWLQHGQKLVGSGYVPDPLGRVYQGSSAALSADGYTALIGAEFDDGSMGSVWVFVQPKPSTTALAASANPASYGQSVTFRATVPGGATGTVTFVVDGVAQATAPLNGSLAQFSVSNFSPGTHTITASYSGDQTFQPSSASITEVVNPLGVISLWANTTVNLDGMARLPVTLASPAPSAGLTIYLGSSDMSKATVTPSVFIRGGRTSPTVQPQVTGVNLGIPDITASALGYAPDTKAVYVTATLAFARCCATISGKATTNAVLNLSAPAPTGGLIVQLASDNTGIATVPATVTFPAQATSVNVAITGVETGVTTIRTAALLTLPSTIIKVTVQ